jgi:hypothetical protein
MRWFLIVTGTETTQNYKRVSPRAKLTHRMQAANGPVFPSAFARRANRAKSG